MARTVEDVDEEESVDWTGLMVAAMPDVAVVGIREDARKHGPSAKVARSVEALSCT